VWYTLNQQSNRGFSLSSRSRLDAKPFVEIANSGVRIREVISNGLEYAMVSIERKLDVAEGLDLPLNTAIKYCLNLTDRAVSGNASGNMSYCLDKYIYGGWVAACALGIVFAIGL
jgi:hypothetical protein